MKAPNIGPVHARTLLSKFGDPQVVFKQGREALGNCIPSHAVNGILNYDPETDDEIGKEIERIEAEEVTVLTPLDEKYPSLLKHIFDPPGVLYVKGELSEDEIGIAIVGTRRVTHYGKDQAKRIATYLAMQGVTVISGMAMGVDGIAQNNAIDSGGRTIAVLGCGVDVVYPPINKKLYSKIIENGAIVSEFPMGTQPARENFPRRNRIISGMSKGVVVVEGGMKSGALITATYAANQGREVFAVPGQIDKKMSEGPNELIRNGATPVTDPAQIIDMLGIPELAEDKRRKVKDIAKDLQGPEKVIFKLLDYDPINIDKIARKAKMESNHVMGILLNLELKDLVQRLPGSNFKKNV